MPFRIKRFRRHGPDGTGAAIALALLRPRAWISAIRVAPARFPALE